MITPKPTRVLIFYFLPVFLTVFSFSAQNPASKVKPAKLTYKIIRSAMSTYGYDILSDGKPMIHQPSIPGMAGNKGFIKKETAEKVAKFAILKIEKGEMPPTIRLEELKKMNATE